MLVFYPVFTCMSISCMFRKYKYPCLYHKYECNSICRSVMFSRPNYCNDFNEIQHGGILILEATWTTLNCDNRWAESGAKASIYIFLETCVFNLYLLVKDF